MWLSSTLLSTERELHGPHIRGDVARAMDGWPPHPNASLDCAEAELTQLSSLLQPVVTKHVKMRAPSKKRARPWWAPACGRAYNYEYKLRVSPFEAHECKQALQADSIESKKGV